MTGRLLFVAIATSHSATSQTYRFYQTNGMSPEGPLVRSDQTDTRPVVLSHFCQSDTHLLVFESKAAFAFKMALKACLEYSRRGDVPDTLEVDGVVLTPPWAVYNAENRQWRYLSGGSLTPSETAQPEPEAESEASSTEILALREKLERLEDALAQRDTELQTQRQQAEQQQSDIVHREARLQEAESQVNSERRQIEQERRQLDAEKQRLDSEEKSLQLRSSQQKQSKTRLEQQKQKALTQEQQLRAKEHELKERETKLQKAVQAHNAEEARQASQLERKLKQQEQKLAELQAQREHSTRRSANSIARGRRTKSGRESTARGKRHRLFARPCRQSSHRRYSDMHDYWMTVPNEAFLDVSRLCLRVTDLADSSAWLLRVTAKPFHSTIDNLQKQLTASSKRRRKRAATSGVRKPQSENEVAKAALQEQIIIELIRAEGATPPQGQGLIRKMSIHVLLRGFMQGPPLLSSTFAGEKLVRYPAHVDGCDWHFEDNYLFSGAKNKQLVLPLSEFACMADTGNYGVAVATKTPQGIKYYQQSPVFDTGKKAVLLSLEELPVDAEVVQVTLTLRLRLRPYVAAAESGSFAPNQSDQLYQHMLRRMSLPDEGEVPVPVYVMRFVKSPQHYPRHVDFPNYSEQREIVLNTAAVWRNARSLLASHLFDRYRKSILSQRLPDQEQRVPEVQLRVSTVDPDAPYPAYATYIFPAAVLHVTCNKSIHTEHETVVVHAMLTRYNTMLQGVLHEILMQRQRPLTLRIRLLVSTTADDGNIVNLSVDMPDVEVELHDTLVERSILLQHESLSFRFIVNLALMPFKDCEATAQDGTVLPNNPTYPMPFPTAFDFLHPNPGGVTYRLTPTLPMLSDLLKFNVVASGESSSGLRFDDVSSDLIITCAQTCHVVCKYEEMWLTTVTLQTEDVPVGVVPQSPLVEKTFVQHQMGIEGLERLAYRFAELPLQANVNMLSELETALNAFVSAPAEIVPLDVVLVLTELATRVHNLATDVPIPPEPKRPQLGEALATRLPPVPTGSLSDELHALTLPVTLRLQRVADGETFWHGITVPSDVHTIVVANAPVNYVLLLSWSHNKETNCDLQLEIGYPNLEACKVTLPGRSTKSLNAFTHLDCEVSQETRVAVVATVKTLDPTATTQCKLAGGSPWMYMFVLQPSLAELEAPP
ncbi:MAG: hypothetical protein MHM6MM_004205 [Cercozoa sp. M6MM]